VILRSAHFEAFIRVNDAMARMVKFEQREILLRAKNLKIFLIIEILLNYA